MIFFSIQNNKSSVELNGIAEYGHTCDNNNFSILMNDIVVIHLGLFYW
jgi:hypothetical protein